MNDHSWSHNENCFQDDSQVVRYRVRTSYSNTISLILTLRGWPAAKSICLYHIDEEAVMCACSCHMQCDPTCSDIYRRHLLSDPPPVYVTLHAANWSKWSAAYFTWSTWDGIRFMWMRSTLVVWSFWKRSPFVCHSWFVGLKCRCCFLAIPTIGINFLFTKIIVFYACTQDKIIVINEASLFSETKTTKCYTCVHNTCHVDSKQILNLMCPIFVFSYLKLNNVGPNLQINVASKP